MFSLNDVALEIMKFCYLWFLRKSTFYLIISWGVLTKSVKKVVGLGVLWEQWVKEG